MGSLTKHIFVDSNILILSNIADSSEHDGTLKILERAMIVASIIGVVVTLFLITAMREESYSALYIIPDSYSNYLEGDKVSFVYGVECFENRKTNYDLKVFLGSQLMKQRGFTLCNGKQKLEEPIEIAPISGDIQFPVEIKLVLKANNMSYDTHFWLKGKK